MRFKEKSSDFSRMTSTQISLIQSEFQEYMKLGGFPLVVEENDLELVNHYFQDILYRDIIARYRISQVNELKHIAIYLASNTGKLFSFSTLQAVSGVKSTNSVKSYLDYLEQSYLFFLLEKIRLLFKKTDLEFKKSICHRSGFL